MNEGSRRAIIAAFFANLGIAIAKLVAWSVTGASSMLAEGVHSLADTGNQGLLLLGGTLARRKATPEHPFGYGRERYFWSFVVSLMLFAMGSLFAIYEGVQKLLHPHPIESPAWAFTVLGVAIVLEGLSLRVAVREANRMRGNLGWWAFIRRSKSPEVPVVLLEDLGAQLGLIFAIVGIALAVTLDDGRYDAFGTLAIGTLLGVIAIVLAIEMKSLLIGESASLGQQESIKAAIEGSPQVVRVIHMRTLHIGPDELLVGAKIQLSNDLDFPGIAAAIDSIEDTIRERVPTARVIYLEPDIARDSGVDPAHLSA
jgi:cation diffusion facilitator family transporter